MEKIEIQRRLFGYKSDRKNIIGSGKLFIFNVIYLSSPMIWADPFQFEAMMVYLFYPTLMFPIVVLSFLSTLYILKVNHVSILSFFLFVVSISMFGFFTFFMIALWLDTSTFHLF